MVLGHTVWKNDILRVEKRFCVWRKRYDNVGKTVISARPQHTDKSNFILKNHFVFFCQIFSANKKEKGLSFRIVP